VSVLLPSSSAAPGVVDDASRRELVTGGLALGAALLAGCGAREDAPRTTTTRQRFTDSTGRRVELPQRPQRIVSLHEQTSGQALLSLGAPVVGMVKDQGSPYGEYDPSRVRGVGTFDQPDLEAIAALRPDLIVAYSAGGTVVPESLDVGQLQRIAPTVALDEDAPLEDYMRAIGQISGRQGEVDRQRDAFRRDLQALRAAVPQARRLVVATVGSAPGFDAFVFTTAHPAPWVVLPRAIGAQAPAIARGATDIYVELSPERLTEVRADVLLYDEFGEAVTELALWPRLPAVRARQAHAVPAIQGASYANQRRAMPLLERLLADAMPLDAR